MMRMTFNWIPLGLTLTALSVAIATPAIAGPYPPIAVETYLNACTQDHKSTRSFCECTMRELQNNVSFEEYVEFSIALRQNPKTPTPPAIHQVVNTCLTQRQAARPKPFSASLQQTPRPYPVTLVRRFVQRCEQGGKNPPGFCQCSIDELQKRMSLAEFVQWAEQNRQKTAKVPLQLQDSVLLCALKQRAVRPTLAPRRPLPQI